MTLQMHYQEKFEQGVEYGLEQGREDEKIQSATRMIEEGETFDKIVRYSGLTLEQVQELKKELQLV